MINMEGEEGGEKVNKGSITLLATVALACLAVGGVSGAVVSSVMSKTIEIPEGTLVVLENGVSYYYYENGLVISDLAVMLPENYGISSDNLVLTISDYLPISGPYTVWAQEIPPVHIMIKYTEDVEWKEEYGRLWIEGRPFQIWVDWPVEYYEHMITGMPVIMILDNIEHEGENRLVFQLLWD